MAEEKKKNLIDVIKEWPTSRKLSLAGVALLSLIFFAVLIMQSQVADYSLLFGNLSAGDAAAVTAKLKEQKVPYRLKDQGKAIYVPTEQVYQTRIELAGAGLPRGGGVGFEIFDKQSFGMTDFAQKINYLRALQGELDRTIASLDPVAAARVQLALPPKRLFQEQQEKSTASVLLKLVGGQSLSHSQIQGIVHLVAGSVAGLNPAQVSIVDSTGRVLYPKSEDELGGPMTAGMLDYQQMVERRLEHRAQALLDRALGVGNSLVKVTAQVDFSQREQTQESYDPKATAIRSEQVTEQKGGTPTSTGGVPGSQSNMNGASPTGGNFIPTSRSQDTTNYEVSKVVKKLVEPVGTVKKISVAVLVAERKGAPAKGGKPTYVPRNAKELQSIQDMVQSALGLDASRGDKIVVVSRPFESSLLDEPLPAPSPVNKVYPYMPLIKYGLLCLGAILLYFLLVRPMVKTLGGEKQRVEHYKTVEQLEAELSGETPLLGAPEDPATKLRKEILQAQNSPAQVIKSWLKEN
jgi:flagellar M-ring protein FliF